jgi:hypothetical protein
MAEKIKCVALAVFTRFVEGYGQVHGDPESSLDEAVNPLVPVGSVASFVRDGLVSCDGFVSGEPEPNEDPAPTANFVAKHVGAGAFDITGPGLDEPERVKGTTVAEVRVAELETAFAQQSQAAPA